jgi:death-on-curing protein
MQNFKLELHPSLSAEFERWRQEIGDEERPHALAVTATEVLKAHFLLADYFREIGEGIGGVGPKSLHLLHSAVSRQSVSFGGRDKWQDLFSIAATLFFGLVKNHAFHDANKRTALLVALYHLQCHGRVVHVAQREFEDLAVRVAESELTRYPQFREYKGKPDPEVQFISRFFRKNTRVLDKRELKVTFSQLSTILNRHGFHFGSGHDNRIDVFKQVEERYGLFGTKRRVVDRRVTTIGFRDWGTEVSQKDIRDVRRATGLTHEAGFDSAVLLQGLNPMESLIAEYAIPLRRLARK